MTGWIMEAHEAVEKARLYVLDGPDLQAVRRALVTCEARLLKAREGLANEVESQMNLQDLRRLSADGGNPWKPWADDVNLTIPPLRPATDAAAESLARCWHELAEYAGVGVIIKNVAIGQQFHGAMEEEGNEGA